MQITTIGLDLAKNVFQVHGIDAAENVVVRKQLRRRQMLEFFKALPPCLIGMEACVSQTDIADEFAIPPHTSITETRKYAYHRKIERNRTAARFAKKFHGNRCQTCNLDFAERYGDIGKGFIEAHHLRPISTLEEGVPVKYDVAADFAVLCSNCHRMIHRATDPSDLAAFRQLINAVNS